VCEIDCSESGWYNCKLSVGMDARRSRVLVETPECVAPARCDGRGWVVAGPDDGRCTGASIRRRAWEESHV
jgi:hypothetical protein